MTNVDSHPGDAVAGAFPSWGPVSIGGITSKLLVAAILINFSVSSMALSALGIPYDWTDGSAFAKLHPSTYLSAVALAAYLMGQLRAGASLRGLAICFPGAAYFACFWMLLAIYGVVVQKTPLTSIIEPYLLAISALLMIDKLDPALQSFVRAFLHALIAVNALVGVFEYLTHLRLIPYVISGTPVIGDPRAAVTPCGTRTMASASECGHDGRLHPVFADGRRRSPFHGVEVGADSCRLCRHGRLRRTHRDRR